VSKDFRRALGKLMAQTLLDEQQHGNWSYHAIRPMDVPATYTPGGGQHVNGDCSKGVQYLCRWVDAPDPMNEHYDPYGNSQTLATRLNHVGSAADLLVGDIVTFGRYGQDHAAMVLEAGADPLLWSFGHQGAPNTYRVSQDRREKQFLRNPLPVYVPTPEDKLRAKTGWFAWAAWRLGEGPWRDYGKADPKVRPDVPKAIPPNWWARYAQFLRNRKKGNKATTK
jgi:hypothetical protein